MFLKMPSFSRKTESGISSGESCRHCCIQIEGLSVRIGRETILDGIDLHVHCGDVLAIVGPNGAGKTTLLRAILGEVPYEGRMMSLLGGRERRRPRIGYVPQKLQFDSDCPMSVTDLVVAAITSRPVWAGISRKLLDKTRDILRVFAADHLMDRRVGELSGGEIQRILLAIAMTKEPELLLLDEPGAGVDVRGLSLFYQLVRDLRTQHDISVILVTHDLSGIASYADRIVLLNRAVIASGTPSEVLSDEVLMRTFGPSLWNVASVPFLPSGKEAI